mmetsp:Transcript_30876/g.82762  ORF Transcript_30876/g.82762 Transcript_30876/m.82762 type:complete len:131 (+) Transcript_30876:525-917(+)
MHPIDMSFWNQPAVFECNPAVYARIDIMCVYLYFGRQERKFRADRIPFDFARVKKVQVGAVGLAKYAMNMVLTSHQGLLDKDTPPEQAAAQIDTLAEPALRFAFRCHQFAGGFDEEANRLFMQLRSLLSL